MQVEEEFEREHPGSGVAAGAVVDLEAGAPQLAPPAAVGTGEVEAWGGVCDGA